MMTVWAAPGWLVMTVVVVCAIVQFQGWSLSNSVEKDSKDTVISLFGNIKVR